MNNFEPTDQLRQCLGHTWYLANDMQFFLIAPPIIYMTWRWKKIGLTLICKSGEDLKHKISIA